MKTACLLHGTSQYPATQDYDVRRPLLPNTNKTELAANIKVQPGDDLVAIAWVSLDKLSQYKVSPPSEALLKELRYQR